jgi:deazaflavin-dependent oxidoreductase (nitroreductase family)
MTSKITIGVVAAAALLTYFVLTALFDRLAPKRWVDAFHRATNPPIVSAAAVVPGYAVVETIGRKTGQARRVPVGGRLRHDTYWFVAGERSAQYMRNIEADPVVCIRVHGRWRNGTAHVLTDDNPRRRLLRLNPVNSAFIWMAGRDLVTVRVDLGRR